MMATSLSIFLACFALAAMLFAAPAAAGCLIAASPGVPLPFYNNPRGNSMCQDGYYCPNSNVSDASTYPRMCPPTPGCLDKRRDYQFCEPQGSTEPEVCPPGFYCPTGFQKIRCPKGYYCPIGSVEKKKCAPMAYCPEGTEYQRDMSGILVLAIGIGLVGALYGVYLQWRKQQALRPVPERNSWDTMAEEDRQFLADGMKDRRMGMEPLRFNFNDLKVDVMNAKTKTRKTLLEGITGTIEPGRVTAIMGPSGAGKTIFFSTLLDKLGADFSTEGELNVNGVTEVGLFRQHIGYAAQHDILHGELTVDDNIFFSSAFRLPSEWSEERKQRYRDLVISAVGLSHVRNTIIGTENMRGVSGGQRKRASIAHELVAAPTALFLDEPTTGLDATTAMELCQVLNGIAREAQITIAMVVHQPRIEIWDQLDRILLLARGGKTVYEGPREDAQAYFEEKLGLDFSMGNPADVIIDGIANCRDDCIKAWEKHLEDNHAPFVESMSVEHEPISPELPQGGSGVSVSGTTHVPVVHSASFLKQVALFHTRSLIKQSQSFGTLFMYIVLGMIAAAMMGSAAVGEKSTSLLVDPYSLISHFPRFYITPMLNMFHLIAMASTVSAVAIRAFGGETTNFWRESSTGSLNRVAYFLGVSSAELYRLFLTALSFAIVAYLMWNPLQGFWPFLGNIFLSFICFDAQASFLGMLLDPEAAPLLTTISGVFVALFNGYAGIPLIGNISFTWYSAEAMISANDVPLEHIYDQSLVVDQLGYTLHRETTDLVVMFVIFLIYKLIGLVLLFVLNREKQR